MHAAKLSCVCVMGCVEELLRLTEALNVSENAGAPPSALSAQMHTSRMQTIFIIDQISLERVATSSSEWYLSE